MPHEIIRLDDHPSALDRTARLVAVNMGDTGRDVYQVKGGYVACLPSPWALAGLFATNDEARAAQEPFVRRGDSGRWELRPETVIPEGSPDGR